MEKYYEQDYPKISKFLIDRKREREREREKAIWKAAILNQFRI